MGWRSGIGCGAGDGGIGLKGLSRVSEKQIPRFARNDSKKGRSALIRVVKQTLKPEARHYETRLLKAEGARRPEKDQILMR
jgi:hypothetical protein